MDEYGECSTHSHSTEPSRTQTGFKLFYSELIQGLQQSAMGNDIRRQMTSVAQLGGQMWKDLSAEEKHYYNSRAKQERQMHRQMMPPTENKTCIPPAFRTKCSPRMVMKLKDEIINQPHKVQLITSMGFESLLHISCRTLRLSFLSHVIDRFDPESQTLIIDGGNPVHITSEDVGKVLGISYAGKRIPEVISNRKMELLKSRFPNRSFRELHRLTVEDLESREVFMQSYLLYILGCFLCPTMKDEVSSLVLPAISIASKAREYDWASYVLKWLVDQVKSYKKKILQGGTTSGTGGCLFFLMIFYLRQLGFYNVETDSMIGWTDKVIDKCIEKAMQTIPSSHINRGGSSSFSVPRSRSTQQFQTPELNSLFQQLQDQFKSTQNQFKSIQDQFKSTLYQQLFLVDQRLQPSEAGPSSSMPNMPPANFEDAGGRDSKDEKGPDFQDIRGRDSENERCQYFQDVGGQDLEDVKMHCNSCSF